MADIHYLENPLETEELLELLCPPVRNWFKDKFPDFTEPQKLAIPAIMNQDHLLLCSPTGSGKTLTAILSIIDPLVRRALDNNLDKRVYCVYISPIKALANDIERNLIGPLLKSKNHIYRAGHRKLKSDSERAIHRNQSVKRCSEIRPISSLRPLKV